MMFEIKGQDELLSLLKETNERLRQTNEILSRMTSEKAKDEQVTAETETKPQTHKNEQKYGRGKDRIDRHDVMKRYRKGESMSSIGRSYGCSTQAIWKIIHAEML